MSTPPNFRAAIEPFWSEVRPMVPTSACGRAGAACAVLDGAPVGVPRATHDDLPPAPLQGRLGTYRSLSRERTP